VEHEKAEAKKKMKKKMKFLISKNQFRKKNCVNMGCVLGIGLHERWRLFEIANRQRQLPHWKGRRSALKLWVPSNLLLKLRTNRNWKWNVDSKV
jgi:hypothetical protein